MRFFTATKEVNNALRTMVMEQLSQPNGKADEPWQVDLTSLALAPHHTDPPEFAALLEYALANGVTEITEEEYRQLQPTTDL